MEAPSCSIGPQQKYVGVISESANPYVCGSPPAHTSLGRCLKYVVVVVCSAQTWTPWDSSPQGGFGSTLGPEGCSPRQQIESWGWSPQGKLDQLWARRAALQDSRSRVGAGHPKENGLNPGPGGLFSEVSHLASLMQNSKMGLLAKKQCWK